MSADSPALTGRDAKGKFLPGCAPGPGSNVMRRRKSLAAAAAQALDHGDIESVLLGLLKQAQAGDVPAAQLVLSYAIGKPKVQADAVDVQLPELNSAGAVVAALHRIVAAVGTGDLDLDAGERLAGLVGQVADAAVLQSLEQRVAAVEAGRGNHGPA